MLQRLSHPLSFIWMRFNKYLKVKRRKRKVLEELLDLTSQNWEKPLQNTRKKFLKKKTELQLLLQPISLGRWIKSLLSLLLRRSFISHSPIILQERHYSNTLCNKRMFGYLMIFQLQPLLMLLKVTQEET